MSDVSVTELLALVGEQHVRIRVLESMLEAAHAQLDEHALADSEATEDGND